MLNPFAWGRRALAAALIPFFVCAAAGAATANPTSPRPVPQRMRLLYTMPLRDGSSAKVYSNGIVVATKTDKKNGRMTQRVERFAVHPNDDTPLGKQLAFPSRQQIEQRFDRDASQPYAPGRVVVVLRSGVMGTKDVFALDGVQVARLHESGQYAPAPNYTTDGGLNVTLASLGVVRSERLFRKTPRGALTAMSMRAQSVTHRAVLDIGNAYVMQVAGASVRAAIDELRQSPSVAYASADWSVGTLHVGGVALDRHNPAFAAKRVDEASPEGMHRIGMDAPVIPKNYAVATSQQSMLNAPGVNAVAAYDEVERTLHQLPGAGVRITNVSVGDIVDTRDAKTSCAYYETVNGPTTVIRGGQRYLDLPTMPLIPVYTADQFGDLGQQSVCGTGDGLLGEIGLDFSVMAPLPDGQQRSGASMTGFGDLLGIAPGASYRLVVPENPAPYLTDIDAALLAAAQQRPHPDVITASLGMSFDEHGFPVRYLGDDPLSAAVMAAIASQDNVVLAISSGDGTRAIDGAGNVAIGPSGGSAVANLAAPGSASTTADDVGYSTAPSEDLDLGNIVAGATTLDDIFSVQPQNPTQSELLRNQQAFPETRWNGFTTFASGFGSLVNLSAPGDNIITFEHLLGGSASDIFIALDGGTSASAPEIAAGAAVAIQVARSVGKPFADPVAVRKFLIETGTRVPKVPQSDVANSVGPQLNVAHAVETLLAAGNKNLQPAVVRVAVAQRRNDGVYDGYFTSDTDPSDIDLLGPVSSLDGAQTGGNQLALVTIAPDWEAMPANVHYQLFVAGKARNVLATTPSARLFPEQILSADGKPLASSSKRTVKLTYRALAGSKVVAQTNVALTFGPAAATARAAVAPVVAPVIRGQAISVAYDLTKVSNVSNPILIVSEPGRINPITGQLYHPSFEKQLTALKGTVQVPLNALQGGGIYGVGIQFGVIAGSGLFTDFAYTRVGNGMKVRPEAPLVGAANQAHGLLGHYAELPYGKSYRIAWDASGVKGATGAILEVSTDGPVNEDPVNFYTVNNPNGSVRDNNGIDTGSVYYKPLGGLKGSATFTPAVLGAIPTMYEQVRIFATAGGNVIGEASDVSTIHEDGVVPNDGTFIPPQSWGVDPSGVRGYFAGNVTVNKVVTSSIQRFDERTNAITGTVASNVGQLWYELPTGTLYGGDTGFYNEWLCDPSQPILPPQGVCTGLPNPTYNIIASISKARMGPVWSLPNTFAMTTGAGNSADNEAMFEGIGLNGPPDITVLLSNLKANTIDKTIDVSTTLGYNIMPPEQSISAVAENEAAHFAMLACFCQGSPMLAIVDLTTGAAKSIPAYTGPPPALPGSGFPSASALDTSNNEAIVVPEFSNTGSIWNVQTGQQVGTSFYLGTPPGGSGPTPNFEVFAGADPVHHLFLVDQRITEGLFIGDNNAHSLIYVIDANGNVVKTIATTALLETAAETPAPNLQVNGTLREAYLTSTDNTQLMPISY